MSIHIVSDKSLQRHDYVYDAHGIGYPADAEPTINWDHIDGPLFYARNGQIHWLTLWERIRFALGAEDIYSLERKIVKPRSPR